MQHLSSLQQSCFITGHHGSPVLVTSLHLFLTWAALWQFPIIFLASFCSGELARFGGRAPLIYPSHSGRCPLRCHGRSAPAHPLLLFTLQSFLLPMLTVCISHRRCVVSAKRDAPFSITPGVQHPIGEVPQAEKGNSAFPSVGTVSLTSAPGMILSSCGFTLPISPLAPNGQNGYFMQAKPLWQKNISRQDDVLLQGGFFSFQE